MRYDATDKNIMRVEVCKDNTGGYNLFFMLQHNEESFLTYDELKRIVGYMESEMSDGK